MTTNAEKIAEILQGTCISLEQALQQIDKTELENDASFCAELDQRVFCCTGCDWWFEMSEMSENKDWICEGCAS